MIPMSANLVFQGREWWVPACALFLAALLILFWGYRTAWQRGIAAILASLEKWQLPLLGAQNVLIAYKPAKKMFCFINGKEEATKESLQKYYLPVSDTGQKSESSHYYLRPPKRRFPLQPYQWNTPRIKPHRENCYFCEVEYQTDEIFEDYGIDIHCCPNCLKDPEINIRISFEHLRMRWRPIHNRSTKS